MRTLILTSEYGAEVQNKILKLLPAPAEMSKIAFIYAARKPKMEINPDREFKDKNDMERAGFKVDLYDLEGKKPTEVLEDLSKYDIIYVCGGNTYYLLKAMQGCNFSVIIREILDKGIIYIGESAGTIVASPDINIASWLNDENKVDLRDLTGLYLIDFGVVVHFDDKVTDSMARGIMSAPYKVKFLHDNEFFLVKDDKVELIKT